MSIVKSKRIWLSSPHMGGAELDFIKEAFATNWIAPLGPNVNGFEKDIASYLGENSSVAALSSGTASLHLALQILGVSQGDLVLCQSMTFAASANPITYLGAHPVFVDSERDTWNMCPEQLEIAIIDCISRGKMPKAIVAVHLYGMPYMVNEITSIANKYDIPIVEDSAESFGSSYFGRCCGTFGDIGVLSFNGNKIITTSGGGALVAKDPVHKEKAIFLATQARDNAPHYQHTHIGYNYRMSNVLAGIGRGQMKVLDHHVSKRRANYSFYKEHLNSISEISFLDEPDGCFSNRWLSCILTDSFETREKIREELAKDEIESRPLWKPMHLQPVFSNTISYTNGISEELFNKGLCLPSGSDLEEDDLYRVVRIIKNLLQ